MDLLKKSVYTAVGLAVMTREKVEEIAKKLVQEAKMTEVEGKQFVEELVKKTDDTRLAIEKMVSDRVDTILQKMSIPTKKELDELEKRVHKIEAKIAEQEKR